MKKVFLLCNSELLPDTSSGFEKTGSLLCWESSCNYSQITSLCIINEYQHKKIIFALPHVP